MSRLFPMAGRLTRPFLMAGKLRDTRWNNPVILSDKSIGQFVLVSLWILSGNNTVAQSRHFEGSAGSSSKLMV